MFRPVLYLLLITLFTSPATAAEPTRVRVLSYNIHHGEGTDRKIDLERIAKVIQSVQPDLVAVNEVDRRAQRSQRVDQPAELARLTGMQALFVKNIPFQGGEYGNVILSRWPAKHHQNHYLPSMYQGEQRGVLAATVAIPNDPEPLLFLATHLDYRPKDEERLAAVPAIEKAAQLHGASRVILAGDLNAYPESPTLRAFGDQWKSATLGMPLFTYPSHGPKNQIDYVLFRPAERWKVVEARVLDETIASDHRPIFAVLEATGQPPSKTDAKPNRGYKVPLIDLAQQTDRQVVVDKEPAQYLGHPTTVLLEDGKTILCVYPKGHGKGAIVYKRSSDGGKTWSERLPTPKSWETSLETPTIHRVIDPQGNKRLILFSGMHPIRMASSEDDGQTWSELQPIGDFGGIVAMGSVERLKNGDCVALFHDDGRYFRKDAKPPKPPVFTVYKTLSKDGGRTWSQPEIIATHPQAHLCEPGLFRSPDGRQVAVLLRENSRKFNSFVIFSDDEGQTWSQPRELPGALTGDRHVGRYAPDGRLFITFRDTTHDSPTKGDWVAWLGRYEDVLHGSEGQYRIRLMDNHKGQDCAYPGLELLPDGTFVTTTYGHWIKDQPPFIVSVRLRVEELDAPAK